MIKIENTDELFELVEQELKEFIKVFIPNIFIHKKLYNLLLKIDYPVSFKIYSGYTDKYQLVASSLFEFICFSLNQFELELYIEEDGHLEDQNFSIYWIEAEKNFPLLQIDTNEIELDLDTFVETIQLSMIETIKTNTNI